jgi:hypothetical protein
MSTTTANNHSFKAGDILVSSWGYGQTNIDYYEVIKVTASTISIRELECDITPNGFMCGDSAPRLGQYRSDEIKTKRPKNGCVRISSYASACLWNGQPKYCSWYA